jgi:hypothetical protein
MKSPYSAGLLIVSLCLSLSGCTPTGNNAGGGTEQLTQARKDAVALVSEQLSTAAAALGTCSSLTDSQLDLNTIAQTGVFGTCPEISFNASAASASIIFDFGDAGCSGPATGNQTVSGSLGLTITRGARQAVIESEQLTIAGKTVSGRLDVVLSSDSGSVTLTGAGTIATAGVGSVSGDFTLVIGADGTLTLDTANLNVTDGTQSLAAELEGLVSDPVGNGNFIPESGTATFDIPNEGPGPATVTIVVTFTADTPVNGTVNVKIGDAAESEYQIPGLP